MSSKSRPSVDIMSKKKSKKKGERKEDEEEGDEEGEGEGTLRRQRTKYRGGNFNALKWKLKFPNL